MIGFAFQVFVLIVHPTFAERKTVQHGQAIKPMAVMFIPDMEGARSVAYQVPFKPFRDGSLHGECFQGYFLLGSSKSNVKRFLHDVSI
jgi:hypothetical protein